MIKPVVWETLYLVWIGDRRYKRELSIVWI